MIYYNHDREVITDFIAYEPISCFIMTQLGEPLPNSVIEIRKELEKELQNRNIKELDANSYIKGKDFLNKIWRQLISVPMGIAIISNEMKLSTIANIFYEIGVLNAFGKESIVIKTQDFKIPSDFIRTEYITYNESFTTNINKFLDEVFELANHYEIMGDALEANPLLTIDYYKRAYLITGDDKYIVKTKKLIKNRESEFDSQTKHFLNDFLSIEKRKQLKEKNKKRVPT